VIHADTVHSVSDAEGFGITIAANVGKVQAKIHRPVQSVVVLTVVLLSIMALMMGMKSIGAIDAGGIPAPMKREARGM
jgi:hypothetical protein